MTRANCPVSWESKLCIYTLFWNSKSLHEYSTQPQMSRDMWQLSFLCKRQQLLSISVTLLDSAVTFYKACKQYFIYTVCRIWGSHSGDYEGYDHMGCNAPYFCRSPPTFWRHVSSSSSVSRSKQKQDTSSPCLFLFFFFFDFLFDQKKEIPSSGTSLEYYPTTRRYNPSDCTPHCYSSFALIK
jgi:hypothetical protein